MGVQYFSEEYYDDENVIFQRKYYSDENILSVQKSDILMHSTVK